MAAPTTWSSAASIHRSEPSLQPLSEDEHANAHQDHETDRRIGSRKIVALGKLVDKLTKATEIDRNSTPTILMSAKIRPSRSPTKMVGSAAGNRICQNCCDGVRLKLLPTLISTRRVAESPSSVLRMTGARPAVNPIITIVNALLPKITR